MQRLEVQLGQITSQPIASKQIQSMEQATRKTAVSYGVSSNDLMGQAVELSQANFSGEQIKGLMGTLAKLNLNAQIKDVKSLTDSMIVLSETFGQDSSEIEHSLSSIIEATKKYAVTNQDILESMKRSGSVFKSYGGSVQELVAMFSAVRQSTRLTPEIISTSLNSTISRIYSQPKSKQAVEQLGVQPFDQSGKQKDILQTVNELSKAMAKLNDAERLEATYKIAGARNASVFLALMQQASQATTIYNDIVHSENKLSEDAAIAQGSFAVQLTKVKEAWLSLAASFTSNPVFTTLAKTALEVTASLTRLLPVMLGLGAVKLGGMASGLGAMGMGFPATQFSTGFNRGMQPMPNTDHGWEDNPGWFARGRYAVNRSGNAMLGGIGNFASATLVVLQWLVA